MKLRPPAHKFTARPIAISSGMATPVQAPVLPSLLQPFQLLPVPGTTLRDRSDAYKTARKLNAEFVSLLQKTTSTLESCRASFETVVEFIQVHLRTLYFPLSSQAIASLQSQLTSESSSFSDLPRLLESHVSWFNYDLMDTLTALFAVREVPEARIGWKAYREKVKEFGMADLGEISIVCLPFGKREAHNSLQLVVTFSFSCLQLLLHHVHHMKKTVATALGRPSCPLYLVTITQCRGLQLCFLLPNFLYSEVFPLGEEHLGILRDAGVLRVECGEHKYLLSKGAQCSPSEQQVSNKFIYSDVDDPLWFENTSTPLHLASWQGHLEEVKWLADRIGYGTLQRGMNGWTPLHAACYGGHEEVASYLISECRCDPSSPSNEHVTPLHVASFKGHSGVVRSLILQHKVDPNGLDCGDRSPLHYASVGGSVEVATFLVEEGKVAAMGKDKWQATSYHYACYSGNVALVDYFRQSYLFSQDVDRLGRGVASYACDGSSVEVLCHLSQQNDGVCLSDRDIGGHSLLHFSISTPPNIELVEHLIEQLGQQLLLQVSHEGLNAFFFAFIGRVVHDSKFLSKALCPHHLRIFSSLSHIYMPANWNPDSEQEWYHFVQYLVKRFPDVSHLHRRDNYGSSALVNACFLGSLRLASFLIEKLGFDPLEGNDYGITSLHMACLSGSVPLVQYLIHHHQCSLDGLTNSGEGPLHYACIGGHLSMVQYLVEVEGLSVSMQDSSGFTPLNYACRNGHFEVALYLLTEQQCSTQLATKRYNCLLLACTGGNLDLVEYLISVKSLDPITTIATDDQTPLHYAASAGNLPLVKLMFEKYGLSLVVSSKSGLHSLHAACWNGHKHIAQYLIQKSPKLVFTKDNNGWTPLHSACQTGHLHVARYLIQELKLSTDAQSNNGYTPLLAACESGNLELVKYLIMEKECDPFACDSDGLTALHHACTSTNLFLVMMLIDDYQLDPRAISHNGRTPLHLACKNGYQHIAEYLIGKHGCNPNPTNVTLWSPLHSACKGGHRHMAKLLVSHYKCDINAKDGDGRTPLHVAAENGHLAVVKYLAGKNNCNVQERQGGTGKTCLHMACISGCLPMVKFMIEELHFDPAIRASNGAQPIHVACDYGHLQLVKYLLEDNHTRCNPEAKDSNNVRPLHYAASSGHLSVVQYLTRVHQTNPTAVATGHGPHFTPIFAAIEGDHREIQEYFISIILEFILMLRFRRSNTLTTN